MGVTLASVLPDSNGKYQITYTVFQTKQDVIAAGYHEQNTVDHIIEGKAYIESIENAFRYIMNAMLLYIILIELNFKLRSNI